MTTRPVTARVRWRSAWRAMAARFPPVRLFERVSDPADWESLVAAEMLTNPRVRQEIGELHLIPLEERVSGPGASWVMASFTHPRPSRFTDGHRGVYYAGASMETVTREYAHHLGNFYRSSARSLGAEGIIRCVVGVIDQTFVDIRGRFPELHDPDSYAASQAFAAAQRKGGAAGIAYDSVRHPGGECLAAFRPTAVGIPHQGPHVALHFDGQRMDRWANMAASAEWQTL